MINYKKLRHSK